MNISFEMAPNDKNGVLKITLKDAESLQFKNTHLFGEIVENLITTHKSVTLNFLEIEFMGSALLGMLVNIGQKAKEVQTDLVIMASRELKDALKVGGLDKIFEVV